MKCKVEGCDRESDYIAQQVCQKHYFRMMRYGTYETTKVGKRQERTKNSKGYLMIHRPDHPLSMANGFVYEHRMVVYEKYGEILPACELCLKQVDWKTAHIDHKDDSVDNNQPSNLRVLCRACNVMRARVHIPQHTVKRRHSITYKGETKTATEWARDSRVVVAGNTIVLRLKKGLTVEQALFGEKVTHRGKKASPRIPQYGEYQGPKKSEVA